ncbi:aspartate aminotransferase family protein [Geochorda subterranea]|uniref:Glutamate-1-semialdehyde 2,1-aminomutase n=1 Tax=Geochorda subterranea TaxID=3109564 RepID=A0ABZ1BRX5_9FIRM|nr:glutamate-1-semialdehyde 2,1-aminomutase [Limnochorda sp. LNt]WRP15318.1 glutamate-1-semialdehyde 2,1-aminomutase [Limnochorda sp. LNt]
MTETRPSDGIVGPGSWSLHRRAIQALVGGVNSPSRGLEAVGGGAPPYIARADGAYLFDVDGRAYVDYVQAFGALILGHARPDLREAVVRALERGVLFGACHEMEVRLAERLQVVMGAMCERVRFTASGTEAVMTAVRLARAATGRRLLVKFAGSYHGHFDAVLVGAGSGASTLGLDESAGIPDGVKADVATLPYNDAETAERFLRERGDEVACVLVEPIVGNFGLVEPEPGFLQRLARAARRAGALVIFDEVITAFRFGPGPVYPQLGVEPDLITFGKILGGGLPIGGYGGRRAIMEQVAPVGPVYQDGTWAGHPLSMASALATLEILTAETDLYPRLGRLGQALAQGVRDLAARHGVPVVVHQRGGAVCAFFTREPEVRDFGGVQRSDARAFATFFRSMLARGILLPPSPYEVWYVSAAHGEEEIDKTLQAIDRAMADVARAA